jgi:hypothetical protein
MRCLWERFRFDWRALVCSAADTPIRACPFECDRGWQRKVTYTVR